MQPLYKFTVPVTVDEGLNVTTGSEITLPGSWDAEAEVGDILQIEAQEDADGVHFTLTALEEGMETVRFSSALTPSSPTARTCMLPASASAGRSRTRPLPRNSCSALRTLRVTRPPSRFLRATS